MSTEENAKRGPVILNVVVKEKISVPNRLRSPEEQAQDLKVAGNNLFAIQKYEEAIVAYSEAIKLTPEDERLYSNRAAAYIAVAKYKHAIKDAEKAIEINPTFANAFKRLGVALKSRGAWENAEEAFQNVLELIKEGDKDWDIITKDIEECRLAFKEQEENGGEPVETDVEMGGSEVLTDEEESSSAPGMQFEEKYRPHMCEWLYWKTLLTNPGNISNIIGFCILIAGVVLRITRGKDDALAFYLTSIGLYAFAGGITNWIAIQMLWTKIPYMKGTGIILEQYEEIRDALKDTVMETFFEETYLNWYFKKKLLSIDFVNVMEDLLNNKTGTDFILEAIIDDADIREVITPQVKPYIMKAVREAEPQIRKGIYETDIANSLDGVKKSIEEMLDGKLSIMTPPRVKALMEDLIASELFWLVVWGNIFGGGLGAISAVLEREAGVS